MLAKLHLYGELADRFGATHEVAAKTLYEALRIVDCNHMGFMHAVRRKNFHVAFGRNRLNVTDKGVSRGRSQAKELHPHQLTVPRSPGEWHLVPAFEGSKSRGFKTIFSIVVGGALLATGIGGALGVLNATGGAAAGVTAANAFAVSSGFLGLSYGTLTLIGASMFLGGLNRVLAPTPKADTSEKKPTAFGFDGPAEIDDEGGPVPILIGECIISGVRIGSSIEATSGISYGTGTVGGAGNPSSGGGAGYGGGGEFDFSVINVREV